MKNKMGRWGVGLIFASMSGILITLFVTLHYAFFESFNFLVPRIFTRTIGIFLVVLGVIFYIASSVQLHTKVKRMKLITDGFYAFSRNPIYSSWILFIIPGIAFILDSVLALLISVFMYIIFRILIRWEEKYLENVFGEEYIQYKAKTGRIFPKLL
jgi:protein-S-isoprenylcysteine O-methyltransferase Ste14